MSWEVFRCRLNTTTDDCSDKQSTTCISQALYQGVTDALVSSGLASAGYASVHMVRACGRGTLLLRYTTPPAYANDSRAHFFSRRSSIFFCVAAHSKDDCWEEKTPPRDPVTNELRGDASRFSSGMKALGDYVHAAGLSFAMYTAESGHTCGGFPASLGHEVLDAQTFASWGVDYLKVDGCGDKANVRGDGGTPTLSRRGARPPPLLTRVHVLRSPAPLPFLASTRRATAPWAPRSRHPGAA